jgi:hypothetical protein
VVAAGGAWNAERVAGRVIAAFVIVAAGAVLGAGAQAAPAPKPPDLAVKLMPSAETVYVGRGLVYTVIVSNRGGAEADGIGAEVTFGGDADAGDVEASSDGATCSSPQPTRISCTLEVLNRSESTKIRLRMRPETTGMLEVATTATAAVDSDASNNGATATTAVRPGKPGPPELAAGKPPLVGTTKALGPTTMVVSGRVELSEPAAVAVSVVDRTLGRTLYLLPGSVVTGAKLPIRRAVVRTAVGDARHGGNASLEYSLRLPARAGTLGHVYALVVDATDLENEQAKQLVLRFRLKKA